MEILNILLRASIVLPIFVIMSFIKIMNMLAINISMNYYMTQARTEVINYPYLLSVNVLMVFLLVAVLCSLVIMIYCVMYLLTGKNPNILSLSNTRDAIRLAN